jgi:hypothetical protein
MYAICIAMDDRLVSKESMLHYVCRRVLELDNSIRFAGFVNTMGTVIVYQYRDELDPLLETNESELSFIETVLRMRTRQDMEPKLGKVTYSLTSYEKVKRATILPDNEEDPILMVSLDVNRNNNGQMDHESLIRDRILPLMSYYLKSLSDRKNVTSIDGDGDRISSIRIGIESSK